MQSPPLKNADAKTFHKSFVQKYSSVIVGTLTGLGSPKYLCTNGI